jgi:hypothetical protein
MGLVRLEDLEDPEDLALLGGIQDSIELTGLHYTK